MKKTIAASAIIVFALGCLLAWRAETVFENRQPEPSAGVSDTRIDEEVAVQRFARALTIPTVSYDDRSRFDADAFRSFREFLQTAYPLVNERANLTVINGHSLVYALRGSDPSLAPVLFMSHYDVVPVEENTHGEWTWPPFGGVVADGVVWGRGILARDRPRGGQSVSRAPRCADANLRRHWFCFSVPDAPGDEQPVAAVTAGRAQTAG